MNLLIELIEGFDPTRPNFRPTELYNESWLVKLVLHQASRISDPAFPIGFLPQSTWFSEALLPTAFKARFHGDRLSESRTNADAVIGHIAVGTRRKADIELCRGARQFTVVEAKIGSSLSPGTKNGKYFDQAARSIACMAEVLKQSKIDPSALERVDFVVLAPQNSITKGAFAREMTATSIEEKVQKRVSEYEGALDTWFDCRFKPLIARVKLHSLSWEDAIDWVGAGLPQVRSDLSSFYNRCLKFAW